MRPDETATTSATVSRRELLRRLALGVPALTVLGACGAAPSAPMAASTRGTAMVSVLPSPRPAPAMASTPGTVQIAPVAAWKVESGTVEMVAFSPDYSRLATGLADGSVAIWDASASDRLLAGTQVHNQFLSSLAWAPDDQRPATASIDGTVLVSNVQLNTVSFRVSTVRNRFTALTWSPDGRSLAVARGEGAVDVYDVPSGKTVPVQDAL